MNHLCYRKLHGWKYQLFLPYRCQTPIFPDGAMPITTHFADLSLAGILDVRPGYAWDGCSGPTIDDETNMRGGFLHDVFYGFFRLGKLSLKKRPQVDELLFNTCMEDGMWKRRADLYHLGVKLGGGFHVGPKSSDQLVLHYAPKLRGPEITKI